MNLVDMQNHIATGAIETSSKEVTAELAHIQYLLNEAQEAIQRLYTLDTDPGILAVTENTGKALDAITGRS